MLKLLALLKKEIFRCIHIKLSFFLTRTLWKESLGNGESKPPNCSVKAKFLGDEVSCQSFQKFFHQIYLLLLLWSSVIFQHGRLSFESRNWSNCEIFLLTFHFCTIKENIIQFWLYKSLFSRSEAWLNICFSIVIRSLVVFKCL